jgi:hypothetical protein
MKYRKNLELEFGKEDWDTRWKQTMQGIMELNE